MKHDRMLTAASLLSLLLLIFHLTDDTMGQHVGAVLYPIPVIVFVVWLCGTLLLPGRAWGYVITLFGGLIAAAMIVLHSPDFVVSKSGGYFFVWTLFMISATGWFTVILSALGLWRLFRARRSGASAS